MTKLTGVGTDTGNSDTRGGGCGNIGIPLEEFTYTVENPTGITLRQVTEVVYRLKGSKYDWWYELYSGITEQSRVNGHLTITTDFGYGS